MLEADEVMVNEMKDKVKKDYYRTVRKLLETKLYSGNVFKAINTCAVSVVRYSAALLGCSRLQLEETDRRIRKLLTLRNGFQPKINVDQLYLSRGEGGKGLIRVQDTVETAILGLRNYVRNSKERCLKRATEALIMATQEQAIRNNKSIKAKIDKTQENSKCRMYAKA